MYKDNNSVNDRWYCWRNHIPPFAQWIIHLPSWSSTLSCIIYMKLLGVGIGDVGVIIHPGLKLNYGLDKSPVNFGNNYISLFYVDVLFYPSNAGPVCIRDQILIDTVPADVPATKGVRLSAGKVRTEKFNLIPSKYKWRSIIWHKVCALVDVMKWATRVKKQNKTKQHTGTWNVEQRGGEDFFMGILWMQW